MQLQTSIQAGLINLTFSSQATKGIFLIGLGQVRNTFVSRVFQKRQVSLNFGVLNNIYLYISSIMTNSRPVAGFLLVLYPPEISDKIPFFHGQNIIGRSQSKATLVIKQVSISQKHARLFATSKKITLTDLGSKNGTKINNEDNLLETLKEVEVDDSMVIYFAQAKCKIEVVKNREEEVSKKDVEAREKERKRAELLKKMEQQSFKHSNEAKPFKDQFKKITFINDIDLNEDFVAEIPKNEKADKIQKQVKKKNPKISKPLATDNSNQKKSADKRPKKNKSDEKHQKKQKNNKKQMQVKTNENSLSKQYRKDQQKTLLSVKMKPIKEKQQKKVSVSPKQQSKSKPKNKSPKIIKNQKEASKQKLGQSRRKNLRIQNQKLHQQRDSTSKQAKKKDKAAKRQLSLQKQAAQPIKSRDKQLKPEIKINKKSKEKLKMNKTMPSKLQQKDHSKQQDEITNTTKKRVGTRKKLPSQSLEKDLRQSGRRNAVGKRVLFSGFVPKMRRKFFTIVQDYTGDFDYLVMKQYTRTFKALVSIAKGIPIVKNTWIQDSEHCQRTMNPNHYRFSKIQYIYDAIDRVNAGQKVFQNYQIYLVSKEYHMKSQQIQALIKFGGGQIKALKGQLKVKDPRKSIAILRNKEENVTILSSLKEQNQKAKKLGFQLIYTIEFLLEACEKQKIDWQNNKIP